MSDEAGDMPVPDQDLPEDAPSRAGDAHRREEEDADLEALCNERPDLADKLRLLFSCVAPGPSVEPSERVQALMDELGERSPRESRYTPKEEVGRGGMGMILRVRDHELERDLAMKVALPPTDAHGVPGSQELHPRDLARFLDEAQVTGQLEHPGVVPVHEMGIGAEGQLFFTMRLVKGRDLKSVFAAVEAGEDGWTTTRVLGLLLKACEALAYAHDKGVVHRDLKPANIMVGRFGEVYVMDWGLAKVRGRKDGKDLRLRLDETDADGTLRSLRRTEADEKPDSPLMTIDGDVVGTPSFMSPEQAQGDLDRVGPRSDVYAMGAILYHLLSGHMPYLDDGARTSSMAVLNALLKGPPLALARQRRDAPAELVAICEKAMMRQPERRYADMVELSDDLRAYLEGRVVAAYETGALAEFRKWFLRNRMLAGTMAIVPLLLVLGSVGYAWQQAAARRAIQLEKERADNRTEEALLAKQEADVVSEFLVDLFQSPDPRQGLGRSVTAEDLLDRGVETVDALRDADPVARAHVLQAMGASFSALGRFDKAEPLLEEAYQELAARLGAEDASTMGARSFLASTYSGQGRFEEAEQAYQDVFRFLRRTQGEDHPDTLTALNDLGSLYYRTGRYEDAEPLFTRALAGVRKQLGEDHWKTLAARQTMALLNWARGDAEKAELLLAGVCEDTRRARGDGHPDHLTCLLNLGAVYEALGRAAEAEPLYREVIAGRREVLGEENPETLQAIQNLVVLMDRGNRVDEARPIYVDLLETCRRALGEDDILTLSVYLNFAFSCHTSGELELAAEYGQLAVTGLAPALGDDHPTTLAAIVNLALILKRLDRTDEAETLLLRAFEGKQRRYGDAHDQTLEVLASLADLYLQAGQLDQAVTAASTLQTRAEEGSRYHQLATSFLARAAELRKAK